jgi:S1-C subfamily serine protease
MKNIFIASSLSVSGMPSSIPGTIRKYGVTVHDVQTTIGVTYRFGVGHENYPAMSDGKSTSAAPLLGTLVDNKMRIIRFFPNSVLAEHGLEPGDVVNSVDGNDVKSPEELTAAMARLTKGAKVKIGFLHRGLWPTYIYVQL